ncbi:MAG TPA: peptide chain release factor N(5)-glutamine methyltransferase [Terracidiphilus sp.]|jgi:release factor glutamine methyltransferase
MASLRNFVSEGMARLSSGPHRDRARADAELLLLHVLGKNKSWLMAHLDEELDEDDAASYIELIERRYKGEPIQYITGETEFYDLPFRVTPDVLIPRPETEHLVDKVIEVAARFEQPRIVDVGTGAGAIAVALAHKLPHAKIAAIDISERALAVARENAKRNGVSIRFLPGDLLAPVTGERFEIVVSNPPYVPNADRATLSVEVREHEPALALLAGDDGLDVFRRLIPAAFGALTPGGFLTLEIGYGQSTAIAEMLTRAGFEQIEFVPDLQGIPRVACARRL